MNQTVKKGVGRPRASDKPALMPAREDILKASAELFAELGFKGTSTRKIAERVGIRQPSLFHHFRKKEDILTALVNEGGSSILDYIERIDFEADPRVELYQLMIFDFYFLMTEPLHVNAIIGLPEVRNGPLKEVVDRERGRIINCYRQLIAKGADDNWFVVADLEVAANSTFGMGEALWSWYDRETGADPKVVAAQIADMAMRALLVKPSWLETVKKRAKLDVPD